MLTETEQKAMDVTVDLYNLFGEIIGYSEQTRDNDFGEVVYHIHALQRMIMAQSAARVYPDKYRLLGAVLPEFVKEA